MGLFSFLKGMRFEDSCLDEVTFRTSRTNAVLGSLLILTGLCLAGRSVLHALGAGVGFLFLAGLPVAAAFVFAGMFVLTYRKTVILSKSHSRIDYLESGLLCQKRATYHFRDIQHLEVCRIAECIATSPICTWTVKGYARRGGGLEVVRLYESARADDAGEVAHLLSGLLGVRILQERPVELGSPLPNQAG